MGNLDVIFQMIFWLVINIRKQPRRNPGRIHLLRLSVARQSDGVIGLRHLEGRVFSIHSVLN
ncbi:hypothetical protein [Nitrosomonas supralitoralis]|uniref:Uncharacterized protein n=1 Tax=Nitrosomonas supralitoralis TaxID=2116706 RepID=A0A2P7NXN1_9PROT|nr:hypothetical protein [Nitrosomonas supralitoralis]PSJ18222.1 hypothetical protein C7H79_04185 [Nitrosomonas supralitoralis]